MKQNKLELKTPLNTKSKKSIVQKKKDMLEIVEEFDGDKSEDTLSTIKVKLSNYCIKEFEKNGPFRYISSEIDLHIHSLISEIKAIKEHNSRVTQGTLNSFNLKNQATPYQGPGFSVITDASGAAAYAALDAWEHYKHDLEQDHQTQSAVSDLSKDLQNIKTIDMDQYKNKLIDLIEYVFATINDYENAKLFVKQNKSIYFDDKYDLGLAIDGINIYQTLQKVCCNNEPFQYKFQGDETAEYLKLVDSGYLNCMGYPNMAVWTSKKYEAWAMDKILGLDRADTMTKEQASQSQVLRMQSQQAFSNKEFFRAATLLGKDIHNDDSLRASLEIWDAYSEYIPLRDNQWIISVDGRPIRLGGSDLPFTNEYSNPIRKIISATNYFAILQLDGHVQICDKNGNSQKLLQDTVEQWSGVVDLLYTCDRLWAIHQDGHISYTLTNLYASTPAPSVGQFTNIKKIEEVGKALLALTWDGNILPINAEANNFKTCIHWTNIKDIKTTYNIIAALTTDGRVLLDGKTEDYHSEVQNWQNIRHIAIANDCIVGVTKNGKMVWTRKHPIHDPIVEECLLRATQGTVSVEYIYDASDWLALRSDGAIIQGLFIEDGYDECVKKAENIIVALVEKNVKIDSKGYVIQGSKTIGRCFNNIETIQEERKQAFESLLCQKQAELKKTKGLFAKKKRKSLEVDIVFLQNEINKILPFSFCKSGNK